MASKLLQKLNDEKSAIMHWSMAADEQMQLCEDMFTSLGCVEAASTSLDTLRQFLRSIKAQYKGEVSLVAECAASTRLCGTCDTACDSVLTTWLVLWFRWLQRFRTTISTTP